MATTEEDLIHIRELITYWTIRRTEAEKMVRSLLHEEKVIMENLGR